MSPWWPHMNPPSWFHTALMEELEERFTYDKSCLRAFSILENTLCHLNINLMFVLKGSLFQLFHRSTQKKISLCNNQIQNSRGRYIITWCPWSGTKLWKALSKAAHKTLSQQYPDLFSAERFSIYSGFLTYEHCSPQRMCNCPMPKCCDSRQHSRRLAVTKHVGIEASTGQTWVALAYCDTPRRVAESSGSKIKRSATVTH